MSVVATERKVEIKVEKKNLSVKEKYLMVWVILVTVSCLI